MRDQVLQKWMLQRTQKNILETPDKFQAEWEKFGLWPMSHEKCNETVERAYSMASYPAEGREIMLNVRVATPPWDRAKERLDGCKSRDCIVVYFCSKTRG